METMMKVCNDSKVVNTNASIEANTNVYGAFKPFAFMTQDNNYYHYYGYIGIDKNILDAKGILLETEKYDSSKITYFQIGFESFGSIVPLTGIPQEAIDNDGKVAILSINHKGLCLENYWGDYDIVKMDTIKLFHNILDAIENYKSNTDK